jgi:MFS-type transporter involved in bile tolerance (Atg22 family)
VSAALTAVGQVLGPLVAGVLADLTGDYRVGFTLLAVVAAAGSVAFLKAKRPG